MKVVTLEEYLKRTSEMITPVQYIRAGETRKLVMIEPCEEALKDFASITSYAVDKLSYDGCATITARFEKDCCLLFEPNVKQLASDPYNVSVEYILRGVVEALEVEGRTNEKHQL